MSAHDPTRREASPRLDLSALRSRLHAANEGAFLRSHPHRMAPRLSAHCWFHRIRLTGPEDVDAELESRLRQAYEGILQD
jgi:hypothetical protein